jgi:hypothetical protein
MADHLESRGAIVVGDGKFGVHAVGTSAYQGPIESLVGGKTQWGTYLGTQLNRLLDLSERAGTSLPFHDPGNELRHLRR